MTRTSPQPTSIWKKYGDENDNQAKFLKLNKGLTKLLLVTIGHSYKEFVEVFKIHFDIKGHFLGKAELKMLEVWYKCLCTLFGTPLKAWGGAAIELQASDKVCSFLFA